MLARAAARAVGTTRGLASATVAENTVKCTFIFDKMKKRVTVPGMVGWSLLATAQHHGLPLRGSRKDNDWDYVNLGEGPGSVEDHVILPQADFERVGPPTWQEESLLKASEPNMQPTSRLAACITLTKEMDGLTAFVPSTNADLTNYV